MRTIRMLLLLVGGFGLWGGAGCGQDDCGWTPPPVGPDLSTPALLPLCDPRAESSSTLRCNYGVDHQCRSSHGYDCVCACNGYWECDQVAIDCDPDGGVPHD